MNGYYDNDFTLMQDVRKEKKTLRSAYNKISFGVLLNYISIFVVQIAYGFIYMILPLPEDGAFMEAVNAVMYILSMLVPTIAIFLVFGEKGMYPNVSSIETKTFFRGLALSFGISYAGSYVSGIVSMFASAFGITFTQPDFTPPQGGLEFFIFFLKMSICAGLFEELLFRGVILGALRRFGDKTAIVVSAFIFGLIHGNLVQMPFAVVLGLYYGYIVCKTGSLLYPIIYHALNNTMSVIITVAGEIYGEDVMMGVSVGYTYLCIGLGVLGLISFVRRSRKGEISKLHENTGVLTFGKKFGTLFTTPVFWVMFAVYAFEYIRYISFGGAA